MPINITGKFQPSGGAGAFNLVALVDVEPAGTWKIFYADGSSPGEIAELALGANGAVLRSAGPSVPPTFAVLAHGDLGSVTSDQHHPQAHSLASHSTKAHSELSDAPADAHHVEVHAPESHSDTDITGAELEDLSDGGATTLHSHVVSGKVSKSIMFHSPSEDLAVEDWLSDQAIRVPAANKHGTWTPGTIYVRVGTAGTGVNTILFRTSGSLAGGRTTRATVNLGTAREATAAITWTPEDGQYLWIEVSAVGGTPPKNGVAQIDVEEAIYA